jgi:hypothetical protein
MSRSQSLAKCATRLGVTRSTVSRWSHRVGFPANRVGSRLFANVDEIRSWAEREGLLRRGARSAGACKPAAAEVPTLELTSHEESLVTTLADPAATDLARVRASYALSCSEVARARRAGAVSGQLFANLARQSEELRRAEQAFVDLAERRGDLIPRDVAKAIAGAIVQRFIESLHNTENALAAQVEIWRDLPAFAAGSTEDRARAIRAWFAGHARAVRETDAAALERLAVEKAAEHAAEA